MSKKRELEHQRAAIDDALFHVTELCDISIRTCKACTAVEDTVMAGLQAGVCERTIDTCMSLRKMFI
jgi:hypothetical protein